MPGVPFKKGKDARRGGGGFRPGAGRKPKEISLLREQLKTGYAEAVAKIRKLMKSKDDRVAYDACKWWAEQVIGKAEQRIAHTDAEGKNLLPVLAVIGVTDDDLAGLNDEAA